MKLTVASHPVMNLPDDPKRFDLSDWYDPDELTRFVESGGWGVGGYLENRKAMYTAPQYENRRRVHMGIDIWAAAGEPVFAPMDGVLLYKAYHEEKGNYGGTLVVKHRVDQSEYYALFGHLSLKSVKDAVIGKTLQAGELIGRLGEPPENGHWPPHLHFQISMVDPGEADMPGVVVEEEVESASKIYPDPRVILGPIY